MPGHAGQFNAHSSRSGMTLIEVLLALSIATLVIALVLSIYHTVSLNVQSQEKRHKGSVAIAGAVQQLSDDLARTFIVEDNDQCIFSLTPASEREDLGSSVSFCMTRRQEGERDARWLVAEHVEYRAEKGENGGINLVRERQPLAGPQTRDTCGTNILITGISRFQITVFDGEEWQESWPVDDQVRCPKAAHIEIQAAQPEASPVFKTTVFLPAGNVISSSFIRAVSPGATP